MFGEMKLSVPGEYRGRNGNGKLVGMEVMQPNPGAKVTIAGVNSKGPSNSSWFYIDPADIPQLIELLKRVEA